MSEGKHPAQEGDVAALVLERQRVFAEDVGNRMMRFFVSHPDYQSVCVPEQGLVKFRTLSASDGANRAQAVIRIRDAQANYVAQNPEQHESVQTWYVLPEGAAVPMLFEDDQAIEHELESAGDYRTLKAHRDLKDTAIARGAYLQPIDERSLEHLAHFLRFADQQAS